MLEKGERGKRIVKRIVPISVRRVLGKVSEAERGAEIAEGVGFFGGPSGAGELEGIDPRAETMTGEGAEKTFLSAMAVSDDGATAEGRF